MKSLQQTTSGKKEVKGTTSVNLGVRIENNLLDVDLSNLEFNADELQAIMEGYKLKKKVLQIKKWKLCCIRR